jgi:hypothetical protein
MLIRLMDRVRFWILIEVEDPLLTLGFLLEHKLL